MYKLDLKSSVKKDLKRIGEHNSKRILTAIRDKLLVNPRIGKPLKGYNGLVWSFRVGTYRVLYNIKDERLVVLIVRIGHRKEVYTDI